MTTPPVENVLQNAEQLLAPWAAGASRPEPRRLDAALAASDLLAAVSALQGAHWGYLTAITGLDLGPAAGEIEALYHFVSGAAVLTLRVRMPRAAPRVPSLCEIIPSATLYERELREMLGVEVVGTPNTDRLYMPDDWPEGVYPLRKDFVGGGA
jgi:Ni,Fe-hydrogenase III component G